MTEVKETAKTPFRLFGKIEHSERVYPEYEGVSFSVRPMKTSERSVWENEKNIYENEISFSRAMRKLGLSREQVFVVDSNGEATRDEAGNVIMRVDNYNAVIDSITVSTEALKRMENARREVILACVETVTIDGKKQAFTADLYDADLAKNVVTWLIEQIEYDSTIQKDEIVGL